MGILSRFADIMKANINELLDKCEDPAKMVDQTLRDLRENLAEVKKETAVVIADEHKAERDLTNCQSNINKYDELAKKALVAGNEGDAKQFISQKQKYEKNLAQLQKIYDVNHANADKMRQMHDKLVSDINELESRKDVIKATVATAKAQEKMNQITSGVDTNSSIKAFENWEEKANKRLDAANAEAELNAGSDSSVDNLEEKYTSGDVSVDDELAKMKAELGL